jgi:hypothetical protein
MSAEHHDLVLAITSHLPHLIAYNIVATAADLEEVTDSEVIKYSAGGFRDFTRIAASDPTMWRDVFLHNKEAVLELLGRFNEDLSVLCWRCWGDFPRTFRPCNGPSAGATARRSTLCSAGPAKSAAVSSPPARIRRRRISGAMPSSLNRAAADRRV